jgi:hypothetical protein
VTASHHWNIGVWTGPERAWKWGVAWPMLQLLRDGFTANKKSVKNACFHRFCKTFVLAIVFQ